MTAAKADAPAAPANAGNDPTIAILGLASDSSASELIDLGGHADVVHDELAAKGIKLPPKSKGKADPIDVMTAIGLELKKRLAAEIANDPARRGYAGNAPDIVAALLNDPVKLALPSVSRWSEIVPFDPVPDPAVATVAALMALPTIGDRIRRELEHDPQGRGYRAAAGSDAAVVGLLVAPYQRFAVDPPRVAVIWGAARSKASADATNAGLPDPDPPAPVLPYAPTAVTVEHIGEVS